MEEVTRERLYSVGSRYSDTAAGNCTFSGVLTYLLNRLKASMLNFISSPRRSK